MRNEESQVFVRVSRSSMLSRQLESTREQAEWRERRKCLLGLATIRETTRGGFRGHWTREAIRV